MLFSLNSKLNIFRFFDKLIFVYPFYTVMFQENGLTATQIALLFVVWKLTSVIFEYPTGLIADKYSRKVQLILAQVILGLGFLTWLSGDGFSVYMVGFILWGISSALKSGTLQAFIYDQLKDKNIESEFKKVYARSSSASHLGFIVSSLLATLVFKLGSYEYAIILSVLSLAVSIIPLLFIRESKIYKSTGEVEEINLMKEALAVVFKNKAVLLLTFLISSNEALGIPLDEYSTLLAVNSGVEKAYLGIFMVVLSIGMLIGTELVHKISVTYKQGLVILIFDGVIWILAALFSNYITIGLMFIDSIIVSLIDVTFEDNIQELIPSNVRASVSSIQGFFAKVLASVLLVIFGVIGDMVSLYTAFVFFGILILILPLSIHRLKTRLG